MIPKPGDSYDRILRKDPLEIKRRIKGVKTWHCINEILDLGPKVIPRLFKEGIEYKPKKEGEANPYAYTISAFGESALPYIERALRSKDPKGVILALEVLNSKPQKKLKVELTAGIEKKLWVLLNSKFPKIQIEALKRINATFGLYMNYRGQYERREKLAPYVNKMLNSPLVEVRKIAATVVYESYAGKQLQYPLQMWGLKFSIDINAAIRSAIEFFENSKEGWKEGFNEEFLTFFMAQEKKTKQELENTETRRLLTLLDGIRKKETYSDRSTEEALADLVITIIENLGKREDVTILELWITEDRYKRSRKKIKQAIKKVVEARLEKEIENGTFGYDMINIFVGRKNIHTVENLEQVEEILLGMNLQGSAIRTLEKLQQAKIKLFEKLERHDKLTALLRRVLQNSEGIESIKNGLETLLTLQTIPNEISNNEVKNLLEKYMGLAKQRTKEEQNTAIDLYKRVIEKLDLRTEFESTLPARIPKPRKRPGNRREPKKFRLRAAQ